MSEAKKLVVVVTSGFNDERSSVAWSVANGGIASGFQVTMFLVSSGVDWVRKGATDGARLNPFDPPIKDMIQNVIEHGGTIMVCPPCAKVRGYEQRDFIDGVELAGSTAMLGGQRGRQHLDLLKTERTGPRNAYFSVPANLGNELGYIGARQECCVQRAVYERISQCLTKAKRRRGSAHRSWRTRTHCIRWRIA